MVTVLTQHLGYSFIGTSSQPCSRSPLGSRLATTLVDRYFHNYFLPFFHSPSRPFLIEGVLGSKASAQKPMGKPLSRPRRPFWIFEVLIEGMIKSKNLFSESWLEGPITYDLTPSAILDKAGGEVLQAVRHCRQWARAPGAARLVFLSKVNIPNLSLLPCLEKLKKL